MSTQNPNTDPYEQQAYTAPGTSSAYDPAKGTPYNPVDVPPPPPGAYPYGAGAPHVPNPLLAGLLGFIPGVGAMYNGQFAKGIAHIAVFAVLSSLADHVNGIFGLFVAGWIFYMVFEAYQTAVARRDGRPLPDPFGFNSIGDRFGFNGNQHPDLNNAWSQTVGKMPGAAPFVEESRFDSSGGTYYTRTDATGARATYQVDPDGSVYTSASAPPTGAGYPPPAPGYVPPVPPAGYGAAYGAPQYGVPPVPPAGYGIPPMPPPPPGFGGVPPGALWLIGLGFFALLGSLHPFAFLEGEATGGLFLIGLAVFLFWRQSSRNSIYPAGSPAARWNMVRAAKGAGVVFIVGLLTFLQGLHVVGWHESWPFLLIFLGVIMVLERMSLNSMNVAASYPVSPGGTPAEPAPPQESSNARASESDATSILPKYSRPENDLSINPDADDRREGR